MRENDPLQGLLTFLLQKELQKKLKIGQKVIIRRGTYEGKNNNYASVKKIRQGIIVAKYPHFFLVQLNGYRETFKYTELLDGTVEMAGDNSE